MKQATRWEQTMRRLDELPPWLALGSGAAVFFCASLAISRLPPWGFAVGTMGLVGVATWLFLSGKPVVKLTWKPKPVDFEPAPKVAVSATPRESVLIAEASSAPKPEVAPKPAAAPAHPSPPKQSETDFPLSMVELPGGEFWMSEGETRHRVQVNSFSIGKYPVTQKQYQELMGENPSIHQEQPADGELAEDRPVENVSWFEAVRFCNRLSEENGMKPCYRITKSEAGSDAQPQIAWDREADGYRLPTEAEWEYACRAGTESVYSFANDQEPLGEHAWFEGNSKDTTHAVGQKKPNGWNLYDLHGNVWEWCWDWYEYYNSTSYTDKSVSFDPTGPLKGVGRVVRGGSFGIVPWFLHSANRNWFRPGVRNGDLGFRCVRNSGYQR